MRRIIFVFLFAMRLHAEETCVTCHSQGKGEMARVVEEWRMSVHADKGVGCSGCHGGDPASTDESTSMSEEKGFKGVPSKAKIPEFCGECHSNPEKMKPFNIRTDQLALYRTSVHGKRLGEGNEDVATCTDCHSSHNIRSKNDPLSPVYKLNIVKTCSRCHSNKELMSKYRVKGDEVEEYMKSYHAQIVFGKIKGKNPFLPPVCNDCHGNHGAAPPGYEFVADVCGGCHYKTENYYKRSPHYRSLLEKGKPRCVDCHGNHNIPFPTEELFGKGGCFSCHPEDSNAGQVAREIKRFINLLREDVENTERDLLFAEASGKYVGDIAILFAESKNLLIKVLPMTHSLDISEIKNLVTAGMENLVKVRKRVEEIREEFKERKRFLYITIAFIVFLISALYIKLREIKKREKG